MDAVVRSRRILLTAGSGSASSAGSAGSGFHAFRALTIGLAIGLALLAASSAMLVAGCAAKKPDGAIGASDPRAYAKAASLDAGTDGGPIALSAELTGYRTTMTKVTTTSVPSVGHAAGRFDIDVYCNKSGCDALLGDAPAVGSLYAVEHAEHSEQHYDRDASSPKRPSGPIYFMEKKPAGYATGRGDWRYVVIGSAGSVVADGPTDSCADCHDEAPKDRIFPVGVTR